MKKGELLSNVAAKDFRAQMLLAREVAQRRNASETEPFIKAETCMVVTYPTLGTILVLDRVGAGRMMYIPFDRKLLKKLTKQFADASLTARTGGFDPDEMRDLDREAEGARFDARNAIA